MWYLAWELPLRSSPQAALRLILVDVTVSRRPTPCRPVSRFRVILITPSTSPQEFSAHFTPCSTSVSGFSARCGLRTAERSASLYACVCLCVFAGASPQLELTCSKHGASHSYYITTSGWVVYDPLRTRLLQCDAHSDISGMRNRPPLTRAASFSITSTRSNFRQSASLLPVSRQPAFRPEMMLWWRYGVFSRPPRLWITPLDCKQLPQLKLIDITLVTPSQCIFLGHYFPNSLHYMESLFPVTDIWLRHVIAAVAEEPTHRRLCLMGLSERHYAITELSSIFLDNAIIDGCRNSQETWMW